MATAPATEIAEDTEEPSPLVGLLSLLGNKNALGIGFAVGFIAGMTSQHEFVIAAASVALTDAADDKIMNKKTVSQINNAPLAVMLGIPVGYVLGYASANGSADLLSLVQ